MNFIIFLIMGVLVGWFTHSFMERNRMGVLADIILSMGGAVLGGFFLNIFGIRSFGFWSSFAMSIVGSTIFLFVGRLLISFHDWRKPLGKL